MCLMFAKNMSSPSTENSPREEAKDVATDINHCSIRQINMLIPSIIRRYAVVATLSVKGQLCVGQLN